MNAAARKAPATPTITVLVHPGQTLPEALGLSPDTPLIAVPMYSLLTIKRGRWYVEVKHGQ